MSTPEQLVKIVSDFQADLKRQLADAQSTIAELQRKLDEAHPDTALLDKLEKLVLGHVEVDIYNGMDKNIHVAPLSSDKKGSGPTLRAALQQLTGGDGE